MVEARAGSATRVETPGLEPVRRIPAVGGGDVMMASTIKTPASANPVGTGTGIAARVRCRGARCSAAAPAINPVGASLQIANLQTAPCLSLAGHQHDSQRCTQCEEECLS